MRGRTTSFIRLSQPAPEIWAASSREGLICEMAETTVRIPMSIYLIM